MRGRGNIQTENGFVSILTVLMFMILTTIVTVSFVTLTLGEQRQTLNDDLAKGAYDAAQAGIEDAKRAIRHCNNTGCDTDSQLYEPDCPGFTTDNQMKTDLGLTTMPSSTDIRVGEPSANQRYTCVTVSNVINKFWGELDPNSAASQTVFLPLKSASPFDRVKISWSSKTGATTVPSPGDVQRNPDLPTWESEWPGAMRTMILHHPATDIREGSVLTNSDFFIPATTGDTDHPFDDANARVLTQCDANRDGGADNVDGEYTCSMTITGIGNTADLWYLQLAPYYRASAFKVELFNGNGTNRVNMLDAGYLVDSTGAVADVYRRVQVMLGPDDGGSPSSSIQSGEKLCKNFKVTGFYNTVLPLGDSSMCDPSVSVVTPPPGGGGDDDDDGGAEALFGTYCEVFVCDDDDDGNGGNGGNGGTPAIPTNYTQRIFNVSKNDPAQVASCSWVITDRGTTIATINNQYCNDGNSFLYTFPTTPYPPRKEYVVRLTITLKSGASDFFTGSYFQPNYSNAGN